MKKPFALIIEDDTRLADVFSESIKSVGYKVETRRDGQDALDRLKEIIPDLIILDLHLPNVMGDEILKAIRADKRLTSTRVMLATADAVRAKSLEKESDLVLLKPISVIQLRELAKRLSL
jgi:CheY-like chemotaxis protein